MCALRRMFLIFLVYKIIGWKVGMARSIRRDEWEITGEK